MKKYLYLTETQRCSFLDRTRTESIGQTKSRHRPEDKKQASAPDEATQSGEDESEAGETRDELQMNVPQ